MREKTTKLEENAKMIGIKINSKITWLMYLHRERNRVIFGIGKRKQYTYLIIEKVVYQHKVVLKDILWSEQEKLDQYLLDYAPSGKKQQLLKKRPDIDSITAVYFMYSCISEKDNENILAK